jgi:hypothetical protein
MKVSIFKHDAELTDTYLRLMATSIPTTSQGCQATPRKRALGGDTRLVI